MSARSILAAALTCTSLVCSACAGGGSPAAPAPDGGNAAGGYPDGPYGTSPGSTIENADLFGYVEPARSADEADRLSFSFGDFYNPSGTARFAAGSPFGHGRLVPRALLLAIVGLWCGASKLEGAKVLPDKHALYQPQGAEFLLVLAEGSSPGESATIASLDLWVSEVEAAEHPCAIEPSGELREAFGANDYPDNIIVDTRDMTIVAVAAGAPTDAFWDELDELLGDGQ